MKYTTESAGERLDKLLKAKGKPMAELEKDLGMSQEKIVKQIANNKGNIVHIISAKINDYKINHYFNNPKLCDIRNGKLVFLAEEKG